MNYDTIKLIMKVIVLVVGIVLVYDLVICPIRSNTARINQLMSAQRPLVIMSGKYPSVAVLSDGELVSEGEH